MDKSSLVGFEIEAGERLLRKLSSDGFPLEASFWARSEESGIWFLYLISPLVEQKGAAESYRELHRLLQGLEGVTLSLADLKLIGPKDDLAQIVNSFRPRQLGRRLWRLGGPELAGTPIDEAFLYPRPQLAEDASSGMQRDAIIHELFRLLSGDSGTRHKSTVLLKDGESFTGVPFSIQSSTRGPMVQFVTEGELAPRVLGIDEIASISEYN